MYPTELTKLTISNTEYPAGKAMLVHTYVDSAAQVSSAFFDGCYVSLLSNKFTSLLLDSPFSFIKFT